MDNLQIEEEELEKIDLELIAEVRKLPNNGQVLGVDGKIEQSALLTLCKSLFWHYRHR